MTNHVKWVDDKSELISHAAEGLKEDSGGKRRLCGVRPNDERGPGWFTGLRKLTSSEIDSLGEADLRSNRGGVPILYDVLAVVVDVKAVHVCVSTDAPRENLGLFIPSTSQRSILTGLAKGLTAVHDNPILVGFANRRLTPIREPAQLETVPGWKDLKPAQRRGVAACCAPGLQLIWGPPGTGKTHVIASSIAYLLAKGLRVLLLSSTNIAVDAALYGALKAASPNDGVIVRVGATQLPALAGDRRVDIDRLSEAKQDDLRSRLAELILSRDQLAQPGKDAAAAQARLADFDVSGYRRALERVSRRAALDKCSYEIQVAEAHLDQAAEWVSTVHAMLLVATDREAVADTSFLRACLASAARRVADLQALPRRESRRAGLKHARRTEAELVVALGQAETVARKARADLGQAARLPELGSFVPVAEAISAVQEARRLWAVADEAHRRLQESIEELTSGQPSTPADEALVFDRKELWQLHASLEGLLERARRAQQSLPSVSREIEELQGHIAKDKVRLQREIVEGAFVVGTTLTQIALRPWVTAQPFDYVIVDEAAAAQLPHVLHAVGRAQVGAVLVGDYMQNGPIADGLPEHIKAMFKRDVFTYFGATQPEKAAEMAGCVVLTEQFRFGSVLTELANRVAYDDVLSTAGDQSAEIVVVTVDGLPEQLRTIVRKDGKQAGWWPIGGLLARALAEHHRVDEAVDAFGVVVPYTLQRDVTAAALQDADLGQVSVGTAHAFQGRQFDAVLADLVEDGGGWVAKARRDRDEYHFDGVRLFNVAATRPRRRLYVLLTQSALVKAQAGPLLALQTMIRAGSARSVDAGQLLGLSEGERPHEDTPEGQLLAALAPYVRVASMHDEEAAIDEVITLIEEACHSLWCWSAWVGKHAQGISGALERAHQRGVEVHVVARPSRQVQRSNRESLSSLIKRLPHVVFMRDMHQKIVIADQRRSIVGSMNMLSHGPTPSKRLRDFMMTVDGGGFAKQLLALQNATELTQRRVCPTCGTPLTECGKVGRGQKWAWICTVEEDDGTVHGHLLFPPSN